MAESTSVAVARGIDQRHRHAEVLVDAAKLPEIGELARAGDVTDRRKERVLHDRPEQHVRAEPLGRLRRPRSRASSAVNVVSPTTNWSPCRLIGVRAPSMMEERDAVGLRHDLRRVAARRQRLARRGGERRGASRRVAISRREHVGHERLGGRIGGVEDDQPVRAEQRLDPAWRTPRPRRCPGR